MDDNEAALYASLLIGMGRIYDVLLSMYGEEHPAKAAALKDMHEKGIMFFPPPSYLPDEDDDA